MKIVIRALREDDYPFIYATYLRNRWFDKSNKTTLKRSTWSQLQHDRLTNMMTHLPGLFKVACLSEDEDTILGYAMDEDNTPYVYLKLAWRKSELSIKEKLLKELK